MDSLLNPVGPRHPNQFITDANGVSEESQLNQDKYIEGSELIPLPSKGVFYTFDKRYINLTALRVRQLDYTDEDILTTRSFIEDGSVFFELLKNVIVDGNDFPASGLVPVDRDTILYWLRSTAFGNNFSAAFKCPKCGTLNDVEWDLAALDVPKYAPEVLEELIANAGELTVTTPLKKVKVKISIPNLGKSKETEKALLVKKENSKGKKDFYGTGSLMLVISGVEVDGRVIRRKSEIESYFNQIKLPISDARYIRQEAEKINLKYDTKKSFACINENCNHVEEGVELPILHSNFFWPDAGI